MAVYTVFLTDEKIDEASEMFLFRRLMRMPWTERAINEEDLRKIKTKKREKK